MNQHQLNTIRSFQLAKQDIYTLFDHINVLYDEVRKLQLRNAELTEKLATLSLKKARKRYTRVARTATKTAKKFVASKTASKFHAKNCAFAKNIKPKNKQVFASKNTALNNGYKQCSCVA